ncbi:hypothetical protein PI125_g22213, partial [Phytophthora idaei]
MAVWQALSHAVYEPHEVDEQQAKAQALLVDE